MALLLIPVTGWPKKTPLQNGDYVSNLGNRLYCAPPDCKHPEVQVDFGTYIADLRERQGFSLRELEKHAGDLSHVYIWRLEKGDRETPSADTVDKLARALHATPRERQIAQLLAKTDIDDTLFRIALDRTDIPIDDIGPVATMSFRGNRPKDEADWMKLIDLVREL